MEQRLSYRCVDVLNHWLAQRAITPAQHDAGRRFERLCRDAALNGHAVLDLSRPRVDGGATPAGDRSMLAKADLLVIKPIVGDMDFALLYRILGQGRDLQETPSPGERKYLARRIRDALAAISAKVLV